MQKFFLRFWRPFFAFTMIIVFAFQGYWLWNTYQNSKKEFLEQVKIETQQILISKIMLDISVDNKKNHISIPDTIKVQNIHDSIPEIKIIIDSLIKKGGSKKIKFSSSYSDDNTDSLLYHSLKTSNKIFKNTDLTVYYDTPHGKRTYPTKRIIKNKNTTDNINALNDDDNFRVHFEDLNTIILKKIYPQIIFSILYIILFLGTIYLLFRSLVFNQQLLKNKEIFTRNMTHELKIPISTIMVAAEGLEKYDIINNPRDAKKYTNTIQRSVHQLSSLVESILQHARADNGNETQTIGKVNLVSLLRDVQETMSSLIAKKNGEILFHDIDEKINLKGNQEQLKQIFLNLIDNSLRYSEKSPVIIITANRLYNQIIIKIKDNGIGIEEKYFKEIFEPYFRITENDLHDVKGFGLGLSFVKKSLENQNGSIKVLKSNNEGTTIEINIPNNESYS